MFLISFYNYFIIISDYTEKITWINYLISIFLFFFFFLLSYCNIIRSIASCILWDNVGKSTNRLVRVLPYQLQPTA